MVDKMNIILLSGGSGKRLWPLSNEVRSKQFLKVVKNDQNKSESMLQRVYYQLCSVGLGENVTIATSAAQKSSIVNQLGDQVSILVEPERRNTYPAIVLSCAHLFYEKKYDEKEPVIVLPVDPYVSADYYKKIIQLEEIIRNGIAEIALIGVAPTYPSEKYGYLLPVKWKDNIYQVSEFHEKPNAKTAQKLIDAGGLWNCGVFAFRLGYVMQRLADTFHSYNEVEFHYSSLKATSFDYEVVEQANSVVAIPYEGEWKDLGTWNTLTEVMGEHSLGCVRMSKECKNTHVINELELPIVVMGTQNMIIAASPDGILVADKEQSSYLKEQVEGIIQRPMFEEREWGDYKVLDIAVNEDGTKSLTKRKKIRQGAEIEYQVHKNRSEVWTVLSGKCIITINGRAHEAFAGDTYSIPKGVRHGLKAISNVELLEVQVGKELMEDGTELVKRS